MPPKRPGPKKVPRKRNLEQSEIRNVRARQDPILSQFDDDGDDRGVLGLLSASELPEDLKALSAPDPEEERIQKYRSLFDALQNPEVSQQFPVSLSMIRKGIPEDVINHFFSQTHPDLVLNREENQQFLKEQLQRSILGHHQLASSVEDSSDSYTQHHGTHDENLPYASHFAHSIGMPKVGAEKWGPIIYQAKDMASSILPTTITSGPEGSKAGQSSFLHRFVDPLEHAVKTGISLPPPMHPTEVSIYPSQLPDFLSGSEGSDLGFL